MKVARTLWDLRDTQDDGYDYGWWNLGYILELIEDCDHAKLREYYDDGACSWKGGGGSVCHFLRSAYENDYDFNLAPSVTNLATGGPWVNGNHYVSASASDPDGLLLGGCEVKVEFYVSSNTQCTTQDTKVATADWPFGTNWDTTKQPDGSAWYVCARAIDTMEDDWDRADTLFKVDNLDPVGTLTISGTKGNGKWYRSSVSITYPCTDAHSGVDYRQYRLDFGAWNTYAAAIAVASDGDHHIEVRCWDNAGNLHYAIEAFGIDKVSTVTSNAKAGTADDNGWYKSAVTVTLTCFDASPGSGCGATTYRVDGGAWKTYAAAFAVSGDGTHTVDYYSVDLAGNTEPTKTTTIKIDTTLPVQSISLAGTAGNNGWYRSSVTVTLSCTDATSGVRTGSPQYSLDGGAYLAYASPFSITKQGTTALATRCYDNAGQLASDTRTVRVDSGAPTGSVAIVLGRVGWDVTWSAADGVSGLTGNAQIQEQKDAGAWSTVCTTPVSGATRAARARGIPSSSDATAIASPSPTSPGTR